MGCTYLYVDKPEKACLNVGEFDPECCAPEGDGSCVVTYKYAILRSGSPCKTATGGEGVRTLCSDKEDRRTDLVCIKSPCRVAPQVQNGIRKSSECTDMPHEQALFHRNQKLKLGSLENSSISSMI